MLICTKIYELQLVRHHLFLWCQPGETKREKHTKKPVLWIRIRICRIRMFLGLLDPDPDPLVRGTDPNPSIIKHK
jgi:hypothetical protein